jgi:hypothetical protein
VEHGDQLAAGEVARVGEEAAREHLQREVAHAGREAEPVEHIGGAHAVVRRVRRREVHVEQAQGGVEVDARQVRQPEGGAGRDEPGDVERGSARDRGERVARAVGVQQRVVGDRAQPAQVGVDAAQDGAQVVVLPEERVEPAAHGVAAGQARCDRAAGHRYGPAPDPAAETIARLQQRDGHAAVRERHRG